MNVVALNIHSRSAVIELVDDHIYETDSYEIWLNEVYIRNETKMVFVLHQLKPFTQYNLRLKRNGGEEQQISFTTKEEFVTLNVRRFGAKGDGIADDTQAIQAAILSCPPMSRVWVPEGTYRIRNLFLKSNMTLELGEGAVLQAFQERTEFPILPGLIESYDEKEEYNLGSWEGNPLDSLAAILTGIHLEHVVICGQGTIDGGGSFDTWWVSRINQIPPYRPRVIFLNHCSDVLIQGIHIRNSPAWNVHPYFSQDIRIYGITITSPADSHNTDGIDPESCNNVEIVGVHFSVGDDCIALKSGKLYMGRKYQTPSGNIRIRQCLMEKGHGAVTIGSEIAGGVNHVLVSQCFFSHTDRGLRIKTRRGRGKDSVVDQIRFEQIKMDEVKSPFVINCFYYCDPDGKSEYVGTQEPMLLDDRTPQIKHLEFSHIDCRNAHHTGVCIYGLPEQKVESVFMEDINIHYSYKAVPGIAAMMTQCQPTCRQGIFARNVTKLTLNRVNLEGAKNEYQLQEVDECIEMS